VTLKIATQADSTLSNVNRTQQRADIQTIQNQVLTSLPAGTYTLIAAYQIFPIVAVEVDASALVALHNSPDVVSIQEDIPARPSDSASNNVIGAPAARTMGYDGTGWIVVILDTGV